MAPSEARRECDRTTSSSGAKRQKTDSTSFSGTSTNDPSPCNSEGADADAVPPLSCPQLPAAVWGTVLEHLDYSEVRTTLLASKLIAFDAVDYVEQLTFDRASELNTLAVQRFRNLKVASLCCLLTDIHFPHPNARLSFKLCAKAVWKIVPFLQSISKLEQAYVGGRRWNNSKKQWILERYNMARCKGPSNHNELYRALLSSFCKAFNANTLPRSLWLGGVSGDYIRLPSYQCTQPREFEGNPSCLCREICSSFPLWNILLLDLGRDMCISEENFCEIVRKRRWTEECLRTARKSWLSFPCFFLITDLYLLDAEDSETAALISRMEEKKAIDSKHVNLIGSGRLKRIELLMEMGCSPMELKREDIMKAMDVQHPSGGYILAKSTFDRLVGFGLDLDESNFVVVDDRKEAALADVDCGGPWDGDVEPL